MQLLVFISLLLAGSTSAYLSFDDVTEVINESFFYPCYTKFYCEYKGKPEFKPMQQCLDLKSVQDEQKFIRLLDINTGDQTKYKDPIDVFTSYYCGLDGATQQKTFNKVFKQGVLPYYKADCPSKNGAEECQHFQDVADCEIHAVEQLHKDGKCNA